MNTVPYFETVAFWVSVSALCVTSLWNLVSNLLSHKRYRDQNRINREKETLSDRKLSLNQNLMDFKKVGMKLRKLRRDNTVTPSNSTKMSSFQNEIYQMQKNEYSDARHALNSSYRLFVETFHNRLVYSLTEIEEIEDQISTQFDIVCSSESNKHAMLESLTNLENQFEKMDSLIVEKIAEVRNNIDEKNNPNWNKV